MRLMVVFLLTAVAMSAIVAGSEPVLKATTEDGRKVFLYPDGTWQYQDKKAEIPIRSKPFTSMRLYEDESGKFKIWVNDNKWLKGDLGLNPNADMEFEHIGGDVNGIILYDKARMDLPALKETVLQNARMKASDAVIVFEETRMVNGSEQLCLRINGRVDGIPYTYLGYYHAGWIGTLQAILFTRQASFDEYRADMEDFLDGLEISK